MRVELRWTGHGSLGFEITGVMRKSDVVPTALLVPPAGAELAADPLPASIAVLLSPAELAAIRNGPVEPLPSSPPPPGDGLGVNNATVQLRMLYVDGVPIAWVGPGVRDSVHGLVHGRYVAQWRTFLGDSLEPPMNVTVPGVAQIGVADAGTR
jgi:hypothetical protein